MEHGRRHKAFKQRQDLLGNKVDEKVFITLVADRIDLTPWHMFDLKVRKGVAGMPPTLSLSYVNSESLAVIDVGAIV